LANRKEDFLKKLLFFLIISIGTTGCGGFNLKSFSSTYSLPSQPLPGASDPQLDQLESNRVKKETMERNLELAGPVETFNPAEVGVWREPEHLYSLSCEPELCWEPCLLSESLLMESTRFAKVEGRLSPSNGSAEEEGMAAEKKPCQVASRTAKSEAHLDPPAEKSPEKNLDGKGSEALASPSLSSPALVTFPSLLNSKVGDCIGFFQKQADSFFMRSLGRSTTYADMMKKIFREKNLPEELFYLALIESGFNPKAFSRAKASGIWQFIGKTAKRFGLKVDKWVDERRDPEKATHAAAEYLKSLYAMFNNWDLATASYNAGEGKILKAMKKANSQDFWKISQHRFLKKETKEYVPMFLAAVTIAQDPQKYGFQDIEYSPPLVYEKVTVSPATSLVIIAKAAELDLSEVKALNPALKKGKTPPNSCFEIKLPPGKKEVFEKNFPVLSKMPMKRKKHRTSAT
jgi:membrane-bound lytic murein transglycosylase D